MPKTALCSGFDRTSTCDRQTQAIAYIALTQRRALKSLHDLHELLWLVFTSKHNRVQFFTHFIHRPVYAECRLYWKLANCRIKVSPV